MSDHIIILGKSDVSDWEGDADADASGNIDIDAVNAIIAIILDK